MSKRKHFSDAERAKFVKVWTESESPAEVAEKLKLPLESCSSQAAYLRSVGVNLKKFPRGHRAKINVDALNAIIAKVS